MFKCVVDHDRRIQYVSDYFFGKNNDQTLCKFDPFSRQVVAGAFKDVSYELYDASGKSILAKGGYLITDGGYTDNIAFIDPDHARMTRQSVLWSEWVESVRKDVECKCLTIIYG